MFNIFRKKPTSPKSFYNLDGIVGKYYEMDPKTEDMLDSGVQLENGMVVLPESSLRVDLPAITSEAEYYRARRYNRWFEVSNLSGPHAAHINSSATLMHFTATYEDGVKSRHSINQSYSWLVKIDSVFKIASEEEMLPEYSESDVKVSEAFLKEKQEITLNDLSTDDVALLLVTKGAIFGSGLTLPSGQFVTGQQMEQLQREFEEH